MISQEYAEFIGFFLGEGCVIVQRIDNRSKKDPRKIYAPYIQITQRDDNRDILYWIRQEFGGSVWLRPSRELTNGYINKPTACWRLGNQKGCLKVIEVLLQGKLPSKKRQEFLLFKEFLDLKKRGKRHGFQGRWYSDEEVTRQGVIKELLSRMKKYA